MRSALLNCRKGRTTGSRSETRGPQSLAGSQRTAPDLQQDL